MKKALIFQGGWDGHEPQLTSKRFAGMLERNGITAEIYDNHGCFADLEKLLTYDLIVACWTMGTMEGQFSRNISEAVARGVGLAGCHGGMCDAFRNDTEWQFMTGSQWVSHPGGDQAVYTVKLDKDAPLTCGLEDFSLQSEQYYIHVDPAVKVFATTKFPVFPGPHDANGEVELPVIYTKLWGKGTVYYNSLGHTYKVFRDIPQAKELMRRGLLWAAR